jgi:hypothetical protein
MIVADAGIELLGGVVGGLNFEIEYVDDGGVYREAVFAVHPDYTLPLAIVITSRCEAILWVIKDDEFHPLYIRFPHGLRKFVDFRRPTSLGGESILHRVIEDD